MADFGQSKEELLRLVLRLEHGIPSHDTFSRVFRLLKPQAFEPAFRRFMAAFAKANGLKLTTHDRREARRATIMRNTSLAGLYGFPGAAAVGRITSRRRRRGQRADAPVVRHYLLSKYISPKRLLHITRSHWGIENQLHWVLDVHFAEDDNRSRCDHAPENLAILRRLALNILRTHPDRASLRRKIKRAGWDNAFLMATLSHMR
jgi:predicted transposase YbfD/YdcC